MILYHNYNDKTVDDTNLVQSHKPLLLRENEADGALHSGK